MALKDLLKTFDLDDEASALYQLLWRDGDSPAGLLARKMGRARATVYGLLDKLITCGLVQQSLQDGKKIFMAVNPAHVTQLYDQKIADLNRTRQQWQAMLPQFIRLKQTAQYPRFQFYEGSKGVQQLMNDFLLYRDIKTYSFWPIKAMLDILTPEFLCRHNIARIENNMWIDGIWPQRQAVPFKKYPFMGEGPSYKREIRIAPPSVDYTMGYWIYGTKVAFLSSRAEAYGFTIDSAELSDMMRVQHKIVWDLSKPLKADPKDLEKFVKENLC